MNQRLMVILAFLVVSGTIIGVIRPDLVRMLLGQQEIQQQQAQEQFYYIHDDATFENSTKSYSVVPLNDQDLAFTVKAPSDWEADTSTDSVNQQLDEKILQNMSRFRSPMIGTVRATLTIQALHLEHEISAKNWLRNFVITNGYAPQGDLISDNPTSAAMYFVSTVDGTALFTYIRIHSNGGKIIVARFDVPVFLKDYIAYLQKKAVDSFEMTYPKNTPVEIQKSFALVDSIKFNYPASWQIMGSDFKNMNRLNVQMQNQNSFGRIDGFISFVAIRRTRSASFMAEIEAMKQYFDTSFNLDIKGMSFSGKADINDDRFIFNRYEIYDVESRGNKKAPQELHFVALGDKDWYVFGFLVTRKEQDSLYIWARNTESFNVIVKSVR